MKKTLAFFHIIDYNKFCSTGCGLVWLERRLREAEVASSNLVTPIKKCRKALFTHAFCGMFFWARQEYSLPGQRLPSASLTFSSERPASISINKVYFSINPKIFISAHWCFYDFYGFPDLPWHGPLVSPSSLSLPDSPVLSSEPAVSSCAYFYYSRSL